MKTIAQTIAEYSTLNFLLIYTYHDNFFINIATTIAWFGKSKLITKTYTLIFKRMWFLWNALAMIFLGLFDKSSAKNIYGHRRIRSFPRFFFATQFTRSHMGHSIISSRYFHDRWKFSVHEISDSTKHYCYIKITSFINTTWVGLISHHRYTEITKKTLFCWRIENDLHFGLWVWFSLLHQMLHMHVSMMASYSIINRISFRFLCSQKTDFAWYQQQ